MWLQADYQPAALFSLKLSLATSSGARALVVPTPFAVKTALVDALLRTEPAASGPELTRALVGCVVAIRPCPQATITNLFARVLKPRRNDAGTGGAAASAEDGIQQDETGADAGPFGRTIAYREYVHLDGTLGVALEVEEQALAERLAALLPQINYFGRRGSFFQIERAPAITDALPAGFVPIGPQQQAFLADGLLQVLDDWGPEMTFDRLNIYSSERIRIGRERIFHSAVLPYRRKQSSRSFTEYELVPY